MIVGGHRPPLQFGRFALSVTCWAHHDFTGQTVLPGEIRTSEIEASLGPERFSLQKRYFTESWIVLAGDAELARPKNGELWVPTIWARFVWLMALKASTLNSRSCNSCLVAG